MSGCFHKEFGELYFVSENGCVQLTVVEEGVSTIECKPVLQNCYDKFAIFLATLDALEAFNIGLSIDSIPAFETQPEHVRYRFDNQMTRVEIESLKKEILEIRCFNEFNSHDASESLDILLHSYEVKY